MKTQALKNVLIAGLVVSNTAFVVFVGVNWEKINSTPSSVSPKKAPARAAKKPKAFNKASYRDVVIKGAVRQKMSELELCYNTFLATSPPVTDGGIMVDWKIDPNGKVASAQVLKSEFDDPELIQCVLNHIKSWTFAPPPQDEPLLIAHRFTFKSRTPSSINYQLDD